MEIYEGDIIQRQDGRTDYVVFDTGEDTTYGYGFDLLSLLEYRMKSCGEKIIVIGNNHENGDLL